MAPDKTSNTTSDGHRSVSRRSVVAATGAAGIASLAGCLGGLGGGGGTVKVGFALPYSGTYSLLGQSITNGFKMRVDQLDGQLGGTEVEYVQKDTEGDPNTGATATREFLTEENVDFVVGPVSSAVAAAMAPIVDSNANAIWLNANAGNDDLIKNCVTQYHFRTSFSNWHPSAPMGQWVYDNLGERAVMTYADYAAGQQYVKNFGQTYREAGGEIVTEVGAPLGTSDYSPFLQRIADTDADVVYSFFAGGDAVNYIKQFHQQGLSEQFEQAGGGFLLSADTLPAQGAAAIGKYSCLHYTPWKESERNNQFVEDYRAAQDRIPNVYACQGYDSAQAADAAVDEAGTDPDSMIGVLEGLEIDSPRGYMRITEEAHDPEQDMDVRQVVEGPDGNPINEVVDTLGRKKVPWSCDF